MNQKINHIITKYPQLTGKQEFITDVLAIREAFKLDTVPFNITVGNWNSGSLDSYYARLSIEREVARQKAKPKRKRKSSKGWVKY